MSAKPCCKCFHVVYEEGAGPHDSILEAIKSDIPDMDCQSIQNFEITVNRTGYYERFAYAKNLDGKFMLKEASFGGLPLKENHDGKAISIEASEPRTASEDGADGSASAA